MAIKAKTFRPWPGFSDGVARSATGVYVRLSQNQADALEKLAKSTDKSLKTYLRDVVELVIEQMIPARGSTR